MDIQWLLDGFWRLQETVSGWKPDTNTKDKLQYAAALVGICVGVYGWRSHRRNRTEQDAWRDEQKAAAAVQAATISKLHDSMELLRQQLDPAKIAATLAAQSRRAADPNQIKAAELQIASTAAVLAGKTDDQSKAAYAALAAGDTGTAKRLLGAVMEDKSSMGIANNKDAADAARALGALTRLTDVREAANLYARATRLDPGDIDTWIDAGELAMDAGNLPGARQCFEGALGAAEATQDHWERMRATNFLGNVALAEGDTSEALEFYNEAKIVAQRLATADPGNAGWQRDLSVSHDRIADVLSNQGNLPDALKAYQQSLAIRERLATADPGNAGWQRDVALSFGRVAMAEAKLGEKSRALGGFQRGRDIIARLKAQSPDNATLPKDLVWFDAQIAALK